MSATRQRKRRLDVISANALLSLPRGLGHSGRKCRSVPTTSNGGIIPPIRIEKVLAIRQQLAEGRYDFDMRLNIVVDRLFEQLNT